MVPIDNGRKPMSNQTNLSVMLDHNESENKRFRQAYPNVSAVAQVRLDNELALVKALRRAINALPYDDIQREAWWHKDAAFHARGDITAILQASSEPKGEK